jgi:hypothetical protein
MGKCLDEEGDNAWLRQAEPVNKFPHYARSIVEHLQTFVGGWTISISSRSWSAPACILLSPLIRTCREPLI